MTPCGGGKYTGSFTEEKQGGVLSRAFTCLMLCYLLCLALHLSALL